MEDRKNIIAEYIRCYNAFDIRGMTRGMHDDIVFENKVDGEVDVRTEGLDAFIRQAELAKEYFTERKQTIQSWYFDESSYSHYSVSISYGAFVAATIAFVAVIGAIVVMYAAIRRHRANSRIHYGLLIPVAEHINYGATEEHADLEVEKHNGEDDSF